MRILLLLLLFATQLSLLAETPQSIFPKIKVIRPIEWYSRQASLWKAELQLRSSAEGWLNLFLASRYAQESAFVLDGIARQINDEYPNSFESFFVNSIRAKAFDEGFDHLAKAYRLQPHNPITFGPLVMSREYALDEEGRKEMSRKLYGTSMVSSSLLNYSYNVLMSIEKNAILITDSDNTSIPIFLLQDVLGVRTDVIILNVDLLSDASYKDRKLARNELVLPPSSEGSKQEICIRLPQVNPSRTFYYALTLSKENILPIKDQLYITGLASQLSSTRIDNLSAIKNNFENRFLLDYLTVDFNGESEYASGKVLQANYLVPMLLLLDHYRMTKDVDKAKALEGQILWLAEKSGKSVMVDNFLDRKAGDERPFIAYKLETKSLEEKYRPVKDNIWGCESEVTNAEYNSYLKFLKDTKQDHLYEICKIQLDQYEEPALSFMKGYHADRTPTKKEKYFSNYPVVNITYEAAVAYCNWLTEQYNSNPEKKFRKVKFRLPTIQEWQIGALGYKKIQSWNLEENTIELQIQKNKTDMICNKGCDKKVVSFKESGILYPWYGAYYYRDKPVNSKGCSLGNFKWPDDAQACLPGRVYFDGFALMSPVETYFPNDIGLYDVVGNVAEMTSDKGKACGGSWNHTPEESTILSVNQYDGASSNVGFRIFMEVVEL